MGAVHRGPNRRETRDIHVIVSPPLRSVEWCHCSVLPTWFSQARPMDQIATGSLSEYHDDDTDVAAKALEERGST